MTGSPSFSGGSGTTSRPATARCDGLIASLTVSCFMSKPTTQDAQVLLTLMDIFLSDSVREARKWWRTLADGLSLAEFEKRFPRGSEGWEHFSTLAIFWETTGSLMRRGLLSEDLAFDTFMDAPPWGKVERIVRDRRKREKAPAEGENFEWIAGKARAWVREREAAIRKADASSSRRTTVSPPQRRRS